MKNLSSITLILLSILFTTSCSIDTNFYSGSGSLITETRNTGSFNKISSEGIINVNVTQGSQKSIEIIADDNIIHRVTTTISNNRLKISLLDGSYSNISITANIIVPNLTDLKNFGSGNMNITNMNTEDPIKIFNSGSGDITMSGSVDDMELRNEGSGDFNGFGFLSGNCSVKIEGSGDCSVYASEHLEIDIDGSANVYYKGNPVISSNISGSGDVINEN